MVQRWQPNSSAIVCKIPLAVLRPGGRAPTQQTGLPPHSLQGGAVSLLGEKKKENAASNTESPITPSQRGELMQNAAVFQFFVKISGDAVFGRVARRLRDEVLRPEGCLITQRETETCECGALSSLKGNLVFI